MHKSWGFIVITNATLTNLVFYEDDKAKFPVEKIVDDFFEGLQSQLVFFRRSRRHPLQQLKLEMASLGHSEHL